MCVAVNKISAQRLTLGVKKRAMCLFLFGILLSKVYAPPGPPPAITVQPLDQTVQEQGTAVFVVEATSGTTISYAWYFNGKRIPTANSSVLGIDNVTLADAGIYYVTVRNSSGTVTSSNAVLTVLSAPLKFTSASMTTNGFTILLSGPAGSNYVILASANLKDWTPVSTNAAPTGSATFTDTTATNRSLRFYKAAVR
jgi:uncharacterized repeat protein (TIGR01451 family)